MAVDSFDRKKNAQLAKAQREVDAIFATAAKEAAAIAGMVRNPKTDKLFSFADYPQTYDRINKLEAWMAEELEKSISNNITAEWDIAEQSGVALTSDFLRRTYDNVSSAPAALQARYFRNNTEAHDAFLMRTIKGMGLSDRVWRLTAQCRQELEMAIDIGLGDGLSAQQMSQSIRQYLKEPDKLFRRVRDKHGNLVLSKAAKAYHPGQGVYRSSYKNALRLSATEGNIAYRTADHLKWQQLDFVVGIKIGLSNNHTLNGVPFHDICDELAGRYPKDFKFTGWHPFCRCIATSILMTPEEFKANEEAFLDGKEPIVRSKNEVDDVPPQFKKWRKENAEKIKTAKSLPYFVRDNEQYFNPTKITKRAAKGVKESKALNQALAQATDPAVLREQARLDDQANMVFKGSTPEEVRAFILNNIAETCTIEIKAKDIDLWNDIVNQLNDRIHQLGLNKFGNIGVPRSRNAEASWSEAGNVLNLNISALRNKSSMKTAMLWKKKGVLYSFAYENSEDYVRAVIDHELGHSILGKFVNTRDLNNLFSEVGKSMIVNGKSFNPINDVLGYYASTGEHEFFAEAFSFYMGKNRNKLDNRIQDFFANTFKKKGIDILGDLPEVLDMSQIREALEQGLTTENHSLLFTNGAFTAKRKALQKRIVDDYIKGYSTSSDTVYMLGGATANGKSTLVASGQLPHPKGALVIDSDKVKGMIPEYKAMLDSRDKGLIKGAANFVHEESSMISKEIQERALSNSIASVFDGINNDSADKIAKKVAALRKQSGGKRIRADYVSLDTEMSLKLAEARAQKTGREVPKDVILKSNRGVSAMMPEVLEQKIFDELYLWDTNINGTPRLILKQIDGVLTIENKELYERFLAKATQ